MTERKDKQEPHKTDLARILTLAGEMSGQLAASQGVISWPEAAPKKEDTLPAAAQRLLGAATLLEYFQVSPELPSTWPVWRPEWLPPASQYLVNHIDHLKNSDAYPENQKQQIVRRLKTAHTHLGRAGALWSEIKKLLRNLSREGQEVLAQSQDLATQDPVHLCHELTDLDRELRVNLSAQKKAAISLKKLGPAPDEVISAGLALEELVQTLSAELDQETADPHLETQTISDRLQGFGGRVRSARLEHKRLTAGRQELLADLSASLDQIDDLMKERATLLQKRHGLAQETIVGLRHLATRRGAMLRQVRRRREQLAQLFQRLPALIGPSSYADRCLLAGALVLARAENTLLAAKEKMDQAHDQVWAEDREQAWAAMETITANARDQQVTLKALGRLDEPIDRLPRQLSSCRAALVRTSRLQQLEAAYHQRSAALTDLTREKGELEQAFQTGQRELASLQAHKHELETAFRRVQDRLATLAADNKKLTVAYRRRRMELAELNKGYQALEETFHRQQEELARAAEGQSQLAEAHRRQSSSLARLDAENLALKDAYQTKADQIAGLTAQKNILEAEHRQQKLDLERLNQDKRRLEQEQAKLQDDLTRMAMDKNQLGRALRQGQEELSRLAEDKKRLEEAQALREQELARLEEDKRRLEESQARQQTELLRLAEDKKRLLEIQARQRQQLTRLARDRTRLIKEKNLLLTVLSRSKEQLASLAAERDRLTSDLADAAAKNQTLTNHLQDDAYPLIQALGLALHQAQVKTSDLMAERAKQDQHIQALSELTAQLEEGQKKARATSWDLSQALVVLGLDQDRQKKEFAAEREKYLGDLAAARQETDQLAGNLAALEADHLETVHQTRRQARKIEALHEQLAQLYPLLSFFLDQVSLWTKPRAEDAPQVTLPEGAEFLAVLIHVLRQENEELQEQLLTVREERQNLARANDHLNRSQQAIKAQLVQILPAMTFLGQSWLQATVDLAESQVQRRMATEEISRLKIRSRTQETNLKQLSNRLQNTELDLSRTRQDLGESRESRAAAERLTIRLQELVEGLQAETATLKADRAKLVNLVDEQKTTLISLEAESRKLKEDHQRLAAAEETLKRELDFWKEEAEGLGDQLSGQSGQVEAAWAALNWLADRSHEAVDRLRQELAAQTQTIYTLERKLGERAGQIDRLEQAQDRMALLFWTMARLGTTHPEALRNLARLTKESGLMDLPPDSGLRLPQVSSRAMTWGRSDRIRQLARQVIRRGLYSLLLAGGLVMATPDDASVNTALPTTLTRPKEISQLSQQPPVNLEVTASELYSAYVQRPFDVSFVSPWEKAKGFEHVQNIISQEINRLSHRIGLEPQAYLKFVRILYQPGQTVSLRELKNERWALSRLDKWFPRVVAELKDQPLEPGQVSTLYRLAAEADAGETLFWDRMYSDFRALRAKPAASLSMVLHNAAQNLKGRAPLNAYEFAGRLSPVPELEKLNLDGFTRLIAPYIRANLKTYSMRPQLADQKDGSGLDYSQRLAQDMFMTAKAFNVPLTTMVYIAHHETYFANVLGDGNMSASPFQIYQPTKPGIVKAMQDKGLKVPAVPEQLENHLTLATYMAGFHIASLMDRVSTAWAKGKAPLCDLDRVAVLYNGHEDYPAAVHRKKLRLLSYLDRLNNVAGQKLSRPRA